VKLLLDLPIGDDSGPVLLRSKVRAVCRRMGFADALRERMELVCNELSSNQLKYARGRGTVQLWEQTGAAPAVDIFSFDFGDGIANLDDALSDGFTTGGTMGKGLGAVARLSHQCDFYSLPPTQRRGQPWHGTAVWARFHEGAAADRGAWEYGIYLRAYQDDRYNGDGIYLDERGGQLRWLHMDGLGHGREAAEVVDSMEGVLDDHTPLERTLGNISVALRGSRGAVAIMAALDPRRREVELCGVGDMSAMALAGGGRQSMSFAPGVLGHAHGHFKCGTLGLADDVVLTASDGLRSSWDEKSFPGLWSRHPQLIALLLGNAVGRTNDDKSVFVARIKEA